MAPRIGATIRRDFGGVRRPLAKRAKLRGTIGPQGSAHLADSIIGPGIIIDGTVQAEGDLRILGRVLGRVSVSGTLELAPTGSVKSDVVGGRVLVAGMVEGNVTGTERVDLLAGARLLGNVKAPRLTIADGATFRGKVEMDL